MLKREKIAGQRDGDHKMSQETLDIIRGIAPAAAHAYDGALDEDNEPIKIGLKREEGHPVNDSRTMDAFKVRISGTTLILTYNSEMKLKDVYATKLEQDLEHTMSQITKYLKKKYKALTKKTLGLKDLGKVDANVYNVSRIRCYVTCTKLYKISGMSEVEDVADDPNKRSLDKGVQSFLNLGGWNTTKRPKNVTYKTTKKE